jgi:hypothetical protein
MRRATIGALLFIGVGMIPGRHHLPRSGGEGGAGRSLSTRPPIRCQCMSKGAGLILVATDLDVTNGTPFSYTQSLGGR